MHVAIVGAGLAGLCAAHYLREGGAEVSVFEREAGPGLMTSLRNGSLLHPSLVEPWNQPGVLGVLLRNLGNPESAMLLRLHAVPGLLGWGWQFLRQASPQRFRANTLANVALANLSLTLMQALQRQGLEYHAYRRGTLVVLRSQAAVAAARQWHEWLAPHGVPFSMLSRDEAVALEPALAPIASQLAGATHLPGDEGGDPKRFNDALAARLQARGVALHFGTAVQRILLGGEGSGNRGSRGDSSSGRGERATGLQLADGRELHFDAVVLAAAAWSTPLARTAGLSLPVQPVKGYSLTLPRHTASGQDLAPRTPVGDGELHIAIVPVGEDRVRVAGTAEFTGFDLRITPARVANLKRMAAQLYPQYMAALPAGAVQPWAGLRPVSPDGVALIGATRVPGLYLNTGQGHTGWTVAAASGHLLACAVLNQVPPIDARPYAPRRFAGL